MQIERAAAISGWMSAEELTWLATQAGMHRRIVEVGSWQGRSTRALADNTIGTVFAVDLWAPIPALQSFWKDKHHDWLIEAFQENTKDCKNIIPMRCTSIQAAQTLSFVDMVFIDADHSYEAVKADIQAWMPQIVSGGLLCGHDYGDKDYGVTEAVNESLSDIVTVAGGCIWTKAVS